MFADVTSANVVGYMNKTAEFASGRDFMVSTFQKVDGTVVTLKDLSFTEAANPANNQLIFVSPSGAQLKVPQTADPTKMDAVAFYYVNSGFCTGSRSEWVPGWYWVAKDGVKAGATEYKKGSESTLWAADYEVPYGTGLGVYRTGSNAATLSFNGQVAAADKEISGTTASGRTWTGNVMPVDYKLKDFSLKEAANPANNQLIFISQSGAQLKVPQTADPTKLDAVSFYYVNPGFCTGSRSEWIPGWYWVAKDGVKAGATEYKKGSESTLWAGEYDIPAGKGFGIYRTGSNPATLVVPTPLKTK